MKGPATPLVGSGDPAGGSDWVVESTTSLLRREPWIEVFEEHIRLPDGRLVDDFYTIRLRNFVVVAPLTDEGELVVVQINPQKYEEVGRKVIVGKTRQAPALAGGLLYLRDDREIVCLDVRHNK